MDEVLKEAVVERDSLFNNMQTIIISTVDKNGKPNASYAPSLMHEGNFYVYVSMLSKHTSNLIKNKKASIMILEDESKSERLFARKRITMDVDSIVVKRDSAEWEHIMDLMQSKFGESIAFLRNLKDFFLINLKTSKALLVYDFGKAFTLSGKNLNDINHMNDKGHTKSK